MLFKTLCALSALFIAFFCLSAASTISFLFSFRPVSCGDSDWYGRYLWDVFVSVLAFASSFSPLRCQWGSVLAASYAIAAACRWTEAEPRMKLDAWVLDGGPRRSSRTIPDLRRWWTSGSRWNELACSKACAERGRGTAIALPAVAARALVGEIKFWWYRAVTRNNPLNGPGEV